jgi:hypothetical protein
MAAFANQFFTSISGPEIISAFRRLRSVFHQKRYAMHARRRYNANPAIRTPMTNFIFSSPEDDFVFGVSLLFFADFPLLHLFPCSSYSEKTQGKVNKFAPLYYCRKLFL